MSHPPIRSYVLRQGRTTPAQQRALGELLPKYGLGFPIPVERQAVFGRDAPLILEIGSGMGETTAAIAGAHPELDFIAVEVHGPGVGSLLNRVAAEGLSNVRVIRHDAIEVLEQMIPDASLAGLHLFFPDPWPKKRHHKRRIAQPSFAALAARKLVPGGVLHAATDWPEYAEHMREIFSANENLRPALAGCVSRPVTKFESRGRRLGHAIQDLYFSRLESAPAAR